MRRLFYFLPVVACVFLAFQSALALQETKTTTEFKDLPQKKKSSFFHSPAMDSPASQLEYTELLLAEGKIRSAMKQYQALVHQWHNSPEAAIAQRAYAGLLEDRRKYSRAFDEFQYLIDNYAGHFQYEEALEHQFRIAHYLMTTRRGSFLFFPGFDASERALPLFEKIVQNAPGWEKTPQAQFYIGLIHEQAGDFELATKAYEITQYRYPDSPFAAEASFRRAHCLYVSANTNPQDEIRCRTALSTLAGFLKDYPGDNNRNAAQKYLEELKQRLARMYYDRAVFYDRIKNQSRSALIAYSDFVKKFPSSEMAAKAAERIEILRKEAEKENE